MKALCAKFRIILSLIDNHVLLVFTITLSLFRDWGFYKTVQYDSTGIWSPEIV